MLLEKTPSQFSSTSPVVRCRTAVKILGINIPGTELQVRGGDAHSIGLFPLLLAAADWLPPQPLCLASPSSGYNVAQWCDATRPHAASLSSTQIRIRIRKQKLHNSMLLVTPFCHYVSSLMV